jgi:hypothetical protein
MLLIVVGFEIFLIDLAYTVTLAYPANGMIVYNLVSILITIEGLLLGLLSLSIFTGRSLGSSRPSFLAVLTIFAVLFSFGTIMLAEINTQPYSWVLPNFFLVDVGLFILVVAVYSWALVETRGETSTPATPPK